MCCLLPLLVIFLLPVFGVKGNGSIFFFVLAMFACHFLMMGGHQHDEGERKDDKEHKPNEDDGKDKKEHKHKEGHHGCH